MITLHFLAAYFSGLSSGSPLTSYNVVGLFAAGIASSLTVVGIAIQFFGSKFTTKDSGLSILPWAYIRAGFITLIGLIFFSRVAFG